MCCLYQRTATYFSLLSVLLVTISITLTTPTQAQNADVGDLSPVIITGVGLSGGFPSGEFGKNITNSGIGLSGYFGYRLSKTPAVVGIDLGYLIYGYERRTEQFSLTIPDVLVAVVTENSLFSMNTFFRLQKWDRKNPYFDLWPEAGFNKSVCLRCIALTMRWLNFCGTK